MDPKERIRNAKENPSPYEDRYVAFVDVLGWSEIVERSVSDPLALSPVSEAAEIIKMAPEWAEETNEICRGAQKAGLDVAMDLRVSHFSDTFVLSTPADDIAEVPLWMMVGGLCRRLLECGHYTRGAIVRGLVRHTPGVLFGPAIIRAHHLESRVAKYPRIIISPEAETAFHAEYAVRHDFDGLKHLDILHPIKATADDIEKLQGLREMARGLSLRDASRLDLVAKHKWFLGYVEEKLKRATMELAG
jgi:hypothetical protein